MPEPGPETKLGLLNQKEIQRTDRSRNRRLGAALLLSAALHGGALFGGEADDKLREQRAKKREPDIEKVLKVLEEDLENERRIEDLNGFYFRAEAAETGIKKAEIKKAIQEWERIISGAKKMANEGRSKEEVVDFLLGEQGDYESGQNSLIKLLTEDEGNCNARMKFMSGALSEIYPEDYKAGRVKIQIFKGADFDKDGKPDVPAHVRVVLEEESGRQIVAEGKNSFTEPIPDPEEQGAPATLEASGVVVKAYLADHGLYEHPAGNNTGLNVPMQYNDFLRFPRSDAAYSPQPNPDFQRQPRLSADKATSEPIQVEYIIEPRILTKEEYEKCARYEDMYKFNEIGPEALRDFYNGRMPDNWQDKELPAYFVVDHYNNVVYLESEEIAKILSENNPRYLPEFQAILNPQAAEALLRNYDGELVVYNIASAELAEVIANSRIRGLGFREISPKALEIIVQSNISDLVYSNIIGEECQSDILFSGQVKSIFIYYVGSEKTIDNIMKSNVRWVDIGHLHGVNTAEALPRKGEGDIQFTFTLAFTEEVKKILENKGYDIHVNKKHPGFFNQESERNYQRIMQESSDSDIPKE